MLLRKGHIIFALFTVVLLFGLGQIASAADIQVMEVKVMPDSSDVMPYAWVGRTLPVWGNVTGGKPPYSYVLDINDDGVPEYSGMVTNPKHILVGHTYITAGTFFARLTVKDLIETKSAVVKIRVEPVPTIAAQVNAAIQNGLRYLYLIQQSNGSWYDASGLYVGGTGIAVLAFEEQGYLPGGDHIFADSVQAGLDYIFSKAAYDDIYPDSDFHNGNLQGVRFETPYSYDIREIGMAMMAITASGVSPSDIISVGSLTGQSYQFAIEEAADWCAFAQNDPEDGSYCGGWRYYENYGTSDNAISPWPAIGLEAAEHWVIETPAFVKDRLSNVWLQFSQNTSNGGFSYAGPDTYTNMATTGGGFCELAYCDVPASDTRVQNVLGYLSNNWLSTGYDGNRGNLYAMYGIAKGARISIPPVTSIGGCDWQDNYNYWLVADQNYSLNNGSFWSSSYYGSNELNTGFAVLILSPSVTTLSPVADAGPDLSMPPGMDITFDGSGSYPIPDIGAYEWDIDDSDGVDFSPPDLTGKTPTLVGGYPEIGYDYSVTVTLCVTGFDGVTDTDTMIVRITSGNVSPIADAGGPYFGDVGQMITFDGSGSYDPDEMSGDHIVSWEWDMDSDGEYDDAAGEIVQWSWPIPRYGVVGLKVTDSFGLSATASAEYTIFVNVPPIADAGGPYHGTIGQLITFDSSGSYDPNEPDGDHIISWEWDMDGDGQYDDATGEIVQWSWDTPHSGVVGLKVTDSFGLSAIDSAEYTIEPMAEVRIAGYRWSTHTKPHHRKYEPGILDMWMELQVENLGNGDAFNVSATLLDVPDYVTILDGNVTFGDVAAHTACWSNDDFSIRVTMAGPKIDDTGYWSVEWDDSGGHHHIIQDVPMPPK